MQINTTLRNSIMSTANPILRRNNSPASKNVIHIKKSTGSRRRRRTRAAITTTAFGGSASSSSFALYNNNNNNTDKGIKHCSSIDVVALLQRFGGDRCKREIWRVQHALSKLHKEARDLSSLDPNDPKRIYAGEALLRRMSCLGILKDDELNLDCVLKLTTEKLLMRYGLAKSILYHARRYLTIQRYQKQQQQQLRHRRSRNETTTTTASGHHHREIVVGCNTNNNKNNNNGFAAIQAPNSSHHHYNVHHHHHKEQLPPSVPGIKNDIIRKATPAESGTAVAVAIGSTDDTLFLPSPSLLLEKKKRHNHIDINVITTGKNDSGTTTCDSSCSHKQGYYSRRVAKILVDASMEKEKENANNTIGY